MAELQPAHYTQGGCHTALGDRQVLASLVCTEGVQNPANGELAVTAGASGLSVDVATGNAFIQGDNVAEQGMYAVFNNATVNKVLAAADPTDGRIDRIIARVYDAQYSGVLNEWHIEVVTGVPGPAPAAPALPLNAISLATVLVPAGSTTVNAANITDLRTAYQLCAQSIQPSVIAVIPYAASGTFVKANYPTAKGIKVRVQGGGGGGGGAGAAAPAAGTGGSSGGYSERFLTMSQLAASETVTVGTAGTGGGGASAGTAGGTSSFGALAVGNGGGAGSFITATGQAFAGPGGGASAGDLNIAGERGGYAWAVSSTQVHSGKGGNAQIGRGGVGRDFVSSTNTGGEAGTGYGAGGGGAINGGGGNAVGGAGSPGIVIVEVYG